MKSWIWGETNTPSVVANAPPSSASDVSSIRHDLDTVMTVQAAHGQLLVDVLTEL